MHGSLLKTVRLGLLACALALLAVAVLSGWVSATACLRGESATQSLIITRGLLILERHEADPIWLGQAQAYLWPTSPFVFREATLWRPIRLHAFTTQEGNWLWWIIPIWQPAAICLAWPAATLIARWRRRRRRGFPVLGGAL